MIILCIVFVGILCIYLFHLYKSKHFSNRDKVEIEQEKSIVPVINSKQELIHASIGFPEAIKTSIKESPLNNCYSGWFVYVVGIDDGRVFINYKNSSTTIKKGRLLNHVNIEGVTTEHGVFIHNAGDTSSQHVKG